MCRTVWLVLLAFGCGGSNGANEGECPAGVECSDGTCCNFDETCVESGGHIACAPLCGSAADCASGCCAPLGDGLGNLVGPYVCQQEGACCFVGICPGSSCCVTDDRGNEFCAEECNNTSMCGGSSVCEPFSFSHTTCSGPMACGPS